MHVTQGNMQSSSKGMYLEPLDLQAYSMLATNQVGLDVVPPEVVRRLKEFNRYKNILPNPSSRVILDQIGGDTTSSYINANFIADAEGLANGYIAAQGPKTTTISHFWRMIWQEDVRTIVMVTGLVEGPKEKCARYWPAALMAKAGATNYGGVHVGVISGARRQGYKIADLQLTGPSGEVRMLKHFWFDTWPDYGVPADTIQVPIMLEEARQWNCQNDQPWVVHCSAGVGRTGTFIGIDIGMDHLKREGRVNVVNIVKQMREGRTQMVQTADQCQFVQQCLKDYALKENLALHSMAPSSQSADQSANGNNAKLGNPVYETEFQADGKTQSLYSNVGYNEEMDL
jgi:protein tyrosine phosphatase